MNILLAVDGSPTTGHMLAYIAAHDELLAEQNRYTALAVIEPMPALGAAFMPESAIALSYDAQARKILEPVRAFAAQQGWDIELLRAAGHPGRQIVHQAETGGHDLIVMGTHGHGALAGAALGSVATHVLAHCRVPVLLVPRKQSEWTMIMPAAFGTADAG